LKVSKLAEWSEKWRAEVKLSKLAEYWDDKRADLLDVKVASSKVGLTKGSKWTELKLSTLVEW